MREIQYTYYGGINILWLMVLGREPFSKIPPWNLPFLPCLSAVDM